MSYIQYEIVNLQGFASEVASLYSKKMTKTSIRRSLENRSLLFTVHSLSECEEYQSTAEFFPSTSITELIERKREPLVAKHTATLVDDNGLIRHVKPLAKLGLIALPNLRGAHAISLKSEDGLTQNKAYPLTWQIREDISKNGIACPFIEIELPVKVNKFYGDTLMDLPPVLQLRPIPLTENILKQGILREIE